MMRLRFWLAARSVCLCRRTASGRRPPGQKSAIKHTTCILIPVVVCIVIAISVETPSLLPVRQNYPFVTVPLYCRLHRHCSCVLSLTSCEHVTRPIFHLVVFISCRQQANHECGLASPECLCVRDCFDGCTDPLTLMTVWSVE